MKKKDIKNVIDTIIKNAVIRVGVTTRRFQWFFRIYFSRYIQYLPASFHKRMFKILQDDSVKLYVVCAHRGSAKSTLVTTIYSIWSILGKPGKKFVFIGSQTEQKGRQLLQNIKLEFETNELLRKDLGPFEVERNQWGATALTLPKFGAKITIGSVEQGVRGLLYGPNRPDLVVIDDAEDLTSARSQESSEKIYDWFVSEILPAADSHKSKVIVLGTLLLEGSFMSRLKESILKGERDGVYDEFPFVDEEGVALWKEKFPTLESVEAERKRIGDEVAFSTEMMLKPMLREDQVIHPEWITDYDVIPKKDVRYIAIGVDPAITTNENSNHTAIVAGVVVGTGRDLCIYMLPNMIYGKFSFKETADKIEEFYGILRVDSRAEIYVEDVAYQRALIEELEDRNLPVEGVKLDGQDKVARVRSISHIVEQKRALFPNHGCELLKTDLVRLKNGHFDLVDAFTAMVRKVLEKERGKNGMLQIAERDLKEMRNDPEKFKHIQPTGLSWWVNAARQGGIF